MQGSNEGSNSALAVREYDPLRTSNGHGEMPVTVTRALGVDLTPATPNDKNSVAVFTDAGFAWKGIKRDKGKEPVERAVAVHSGKASLWQAFRWLDPLTLLSVATDADSDPYYQRRKKVRDPSLATQLFERDLEYHTWGRREWPHRRYSMHWGTRDRLVPLSMHETRGSSYGRVPKYREAGSVLFSAMRDRPIEWKEMRVDPLKYCVPKTFRFDDSFVAYEGKAYAYWQGVVKTQEQLRKLLALPVTVLFHFQREVPQEEVEESIAEIQKVRMQVTVLVRAAVSCKGSDPDFSSIARRIESPSVMKYAQRLQGPIVLDAYLSMVPGAPMSPSITDFHHGIDDPEAYIDAITSRNSHYGPMGDVSIGFDPDTLQAILEHFVNVGGVHVCGKTKWGKTTFILFLLRQLVGKKFVVIHSTTAKNEAVFEVVQDLGGQLCKISYQDPPKAEWEALKEQIRKDVAEFIANFKALVAANAERCEGLPMVVYPEFDSEAYEYWLTLFIPALRQLWGELGVVTKDYVGPYAYQLLGLFIDNASNWRGEDLHEVIRNVIIAQITGSVNEGMITVIASHDVWDKPPKQTDKFDLSLRSACNFNWLVHWDEIAKQQTLMYMDTNYDEKRGRYPQTRTVNTTLELYMARHSQRRVTI